MHRYIVCIGSNYNRKENLTFARQKLTESFSSICFAPELETEPLFFKNPALFSNQVVVRKIKKRRKFVWTLTCFYMITK